MTASGGIPAFWMGGLIIWTVLVELAEVEVIRPAATKAVLWAVEWLLVWMVISVVLCRIYK